MDTFLLGNASGENFTKALAASFLVCGAALVLGYRKRSPKPPLPPGPPGWPLVGNAFDVPAEEFWLKYKEWSDLYGSDVIYLNIMGSPVIVLNSLEACKTLLETRASNYSSRPEMPMMNDLVGFGWNIGFIPYDEKWKESYRGHCRLFAGSFILDVAYGLDIQSKDDFYIQLAERGMRAMALAGTFSGYLVNFIPSLKYLPWWFPGVQFKRDARVWRRDAEAMPRDCLRFAEDALKRGDARPCFATQLLQELEQENGEFAEKMKVIHDVLGSIYSGKYYMCGSRFTVVSSFTTFLLTMVQNPDVLKRAQKDIDEAVSQLGRLPDFREYRALPYIQALVWEVLRWRPVAPVAVPHFATEDDVYNGYCIPAGSTVFANSWAVLHDETVYGPNPDLFDPSRFMNASNDDINPEISMGYDMFGFGRRICPARLVAVESLWIFVVSVLAVFDIKAADGEENIGKYTSGMLIHPHPFRMQILPRSIDAANLIRNGVIASL
ncbi:hypothetical protein H1R20_g8621, partial [Candolleomyces eurysporus]